MPTWDIIREDIAACETAGIECFVARPNRDSNRRSEKLDKAFAFENFTYDKTIDCYICPCKHELKYMKINRCKGVERRVYMNRAACRNCPDRGKCVTSKFKSIHRIPSQDSLDKVNARTKSNPEIYRKRQEIVEHPFGTIKSAWGFRQFLCRKKPKVEAETSLAYWAYNLRRVFNIFSKENLNLIKVIRA